MNPTSERPAPVSLAAAEGLAPTGLADDIRAARERALVAEVDLLVLATAWADAHPDLDEGGRPVPPSRVDDHALAAHLAGIDPDEDVDSPSWAGLPPVAWEAPAGFATACGMSARAGQGLLRDALILRHRLPRVWDRVRDGEVPAWRARKVAQEVAGAPDDVAAAVDSAVAPLADRAGQVTVRRLVDEMMVLLYPEYVELASLEALDRRYVRFDHHSINHTGVAQMDIRADYADLHDFDATLNGVAAALDRLDPDARRDSKEVRRARAIGVLADPELAQRLLTEDGDQPAEAEVASKGPRSRVRLELRITDLALLGLDPVAQCEPDDGTGFTTLTERVAAWCGRPATEVVVQPVLDPDAHHGTDAYQIRGSLRDHVDLRDRHCLFPFCTQPARACDHDHVVPHGQGGASCTCNLVPLCRHHHRLKTAAGYRSTVVEPGSVWWHTPHGHEFVVDAVGTLPLHRAPPTGDGCLQQSA